TRQVHFRDEMPGALIRCSSLELAARRQRECDVLAHGFPWKQLFEFLKDKHAVGPGPFDNGAVEQNATFNRLDVTADGLQHCRFSTAGWSENYKTIRAQDIEADAIGGRDAL